MKDMKTRFIERAVFRPSLAVSIPLALAWLVGSFGFGYILSSILTVVVVVLAVVELQIVIDKVVERRSEDHTTQHRDLTGLVFETNLWLNRIIATVWTSYPKFIEQLAQEKVNPVLQAKKPAALKSITLSQLDLGTQPPVIERLVTNRTRNLNEFIFDVKLDYNGNMTASLTAEHEKAKLPPLSLSNVKTTVDLRVHVRLLQNREPFVSWVKVQLLNHLDVDAELYPVDILAAPFLRGWIFHFLEEGVDELLLYPKSFKLDVLSLVSPDGPVEDGKRNDGLIPEDSDQELAAQVKPRGFLGLA